MPPAPSPYKQPVSVLVVIHTPALEVLLLERADHPGYWQSVTGGVDPGEELAAAAAREVFEETGLRAGEHRLDAWGSQTRFEIYPEWRYRYAPGVTHNIERDFGLLVPAALPVTVAPREHLGYVWLPWGEAAARCFSPSNAAAIRRLPGRAAARGG